MQSPPTSRWPPGSRSCLPAPRLQHRPRPPRPSRRDLTAAGMMECKKALEEAGGDFDKAVEALRISGAAKAAKRGAERTASNGVVFAKGNTLVELLCETDFVAKGADFVGLAEKVLEAAVAAGVKTSDELAAVALGGGTVASEIENLAGVIGEKLELGRVAHFDGDVAVYLHRRSPDLPPAVGVLVAYS
ncbi:MAG: translation elongation factor Ts, partial [Actinobacteria bacterium]|nr:translation elongation factor Ts [Actinomycetota bacterium]